MNSILFEDNEMKVYDNNCKEIFVLNKKSNITVRIGVSQSRINLSWFHCGAIIQHQGPNQAYLEKR